MWVNLLVFLTSEKNLQDHADPSGGKEPPQQVTILEVSALVYFLLKKCVRNEKCTIEM